MNCSLLPYCIFFEVKINRNLKGTLILARKVGEKDNMMMFLLGENTLSLEEQSLRNFLETKSTNSINLPILLNNLTAPIQRKTHR